MGKITRTQLLNMVKFYREKFDLRGNLDTQSKSYYEWYSADEILKFIQDAGFKADEQGVIQKPAADVFSGIRIYFGAHLNSFEAQQVGAAAGVKIDYQFYNNSIIVATKQATADDFKNANPPATPPTKLADYHRDIIDEALTDEEKEKTGGGLVHVLGHETKEDYKSLRAAIEYATLCPPNCNHTVKDVGYDVYHGMCKTCFP